MVSLYRTPLAARAAIALTGVCALIAASCSGAPSNDADFPRPPPVRAKTPGVAPAADIAAPSVWPIDDDPGRLLGLDRRALRALLGKPGFVRRDDPARMWRYRHATCLLDLFLYADGGASAPSFRVRHVEARAGDSNAVSPRICLRTLLTGRAAQSSG